jgi:DNA-binding CsgD family transcriptional regulator
LYNAGFKTPEIAELMGIVIPTVYRHLDRIFWKLEVNRVRDAIRKGICER